MQNRPAHDHIGRADQGPGRDVGPEAAPGRRWAHAEDPGRGDEAGHDRGVLLAQEAQRQGCGRPPHAVPFESRVNRQQAEAGGHELRPPHHVRHGLDVDRMDREHEPRDERRGLPRPPPRERGDGNRRPGVPEQIHEVIPHGTGRQAIEGEPRHDERPVHLAGEFRRPVRMGERPPDSRRCVDQGIEDDDIHVVHREPVPQGPEVDDDGAGSNEEGDPRCGAQFDHGGERRLRSWAVSQSAVTESPRIRQKKASLR